jgi:hypothetical protein
MVNKKQLQKVGNASRACAKITRLIATCRFLSPPALRYRHR